MQEKSVVLLFIKAPVRGQVKSRLAAVIGEDRALALYSYFVMDVVDMLNRGRYSFRICFHPPALRSQVEKWIGPGHRYMPQDGNDLGERMEHAFRQVFSEGFTRAVLIGSDIPDLSESVIREAFSALEKNDTVLGPASDGGYYLIGFNRQTLVPHAFKNIAWSTSTVFQETMLKISGENMRIHLVPGWSDVDSLDDLRTLFSRNRQSAFRTSRTMEFLYAYGRDIFNR